MVFAPGVLADAPRWLEWWRSARPGAPVFLDAASTPADPDFYDYERAEWFTTPRDTGERWIAGPFLDHSGTNEHILTLTLPVVRDGAFLGVAGADIAVGGIEAVGGAALAALGTRPRSSTTAAGSSRRTRRAASSARSGPAPSAPGRRTTTTCWSATRACSGAWWSRADGSAAPVDEAHVPESHPAAGRAG